MRKNDPTLKPKTVALIFGGLVVVLGAALFYRISTGAQNSATPVSQNSIVQTKTNGSAKVDDKATATATPATTAAEQPKATYAKVSVPTDCSNYTFENAPATATNEADLKQSLLGEWRGCVTTPWVPKYLVSITFKEDGTYSSRLLQPVNGNPESALYYGTDDDNANKTYGITGFEPTNKTGTGNLVVYFNAGTTVFESVPEYKVMGNTLSFSFNHRDRYGPLKFELVRVNQD